MLQYSVDRVKIAWMGIPLEDGLSEGTFVTFVNSKPAWTWIPDGLGGGIRIPNADTSGICTLSIDVETKEHSILLSLAIRDRLSKDVIGSLTMVDLSNGQTWTCGQTYIVDDPNDQRATDSVGGQWVFQYGSRFTTPGANGIANNPALLAGNFSSGPNTNPFF